MRRRLAPALRGRITRRALAHSPAIWNVIGATSVLFGVVHLAVAATVPAFDASRLLVQAAFIVVLGVTILATQPPEPGSKASHVIVAAVSVSVATAVFAHAPYGAVALVSAVFIPLIIAVWFEQRTIAAAHLAGAATLLVAASVAGDDTGRTLTATLCILPASAMMLGVVMAIFDAMEAQTTAMDRVVRHDHLTGAGNERMLTEELAAALVRGRGLAGRFALVDLTIDDFASLDLHVGHAAADAVLAGLAHELAATGDAGGTVVTRLNDAHFVVLLPGADATTADTYIRAVRARFPGTLRGQPLIVRAGYARYPADAGTAHELRTLAQQRRDAPEGAATCGGSTIPPTWNVVLDAPEPVAMPDLPRRVNRRDLATDPMAWRWIGAVTFANGVTIGAATHLIGAAPSPLTWVASSAMVVVGLIRLVSKPPGISTVWNHLFVALGYLLPFGATVAAAPHAEWMIGAALLAPLGVVARLVDRPLIVAHLTAATVPPIVLAVSGFVDAPSRVALASLVLVTWILAGCTAAVFKAAEVQWAEVTRLVGHDPLTGAATAALYDDHLATELVRHESLQLALLVGEFDLEGFEGMARSRGRGHAAVLLRAVADRATRAAGTGATVARIEGSCFRVLIPITAMDDAYPTIQAIHDAVDDALVDVPGLIVRSGFAEVIAGVDDPRDALLLARERRRTALPAAA